LYTTQSGGQKAKKRGRKASRKGRLEGKTLERSRKRLAKEKEGSRGKGVWLAKGKLERRTDLCDTAPRLKDLLFLRVRGRGELAGSPRTPLLLPLDTPLLLWCRLVLGSIAAAFIRIHTLHSVVLCTHHQTHTLFSTTC